MKKHQYNPDSCIACTSCVAYCPVSAATRKFAGPKMMGPALERFRGGETNTDFSLDYCANCKNCDISCPSGVPISTARRAFQYERFNPGALAAEAMRDTRRPAVAAAGAIS